MVKKKATKKSAVRRGANEKKLAAERTMRAIKKKPKQGSIFKKAEDMKDFMLENGIQMLKITDPDTQQPIELLLAETTIYNYNEQQRQDNAQPNADSDSEEGVPLDGDINPEKLMAKLQQEEETDEDLLYHSAQ